MKTISIRDLHAKTGYWVRRSLEFDEIHVKDRGRVVARLVPYKESDETPFFSRRTLTPAFKRLASSGKLKQGTDSTQMISEDREERTS